MCLSMDLQQSIHATSHDVTLAGMVELSTIVVIIIIAASLLDIAYSVLTMLLVEMIFAIILLARALLPIPSPLVLRIVHIPTQLGTIIMVILAITGLKRDTVIPHGSHHLAQPAHRIP